MFCAIDMVAVPITISFILAGMVVIGGIALYDQRRRSLRGSMPHGAEAALWSVIEIMPDPRNHLAIKDPTSELRLTDDERRQAAEAAVQARQRAEVSDDRPAKRAAAERLAVARQAAVDKRDELERERERERVQQQEIEQEHERQREKYRRVVAEDEVNPFVSPVLFDGLTAVAANAPVANFSIADFAPADLAAVARTMPSGETPPTIDLREDTGELHVVHHRAS